MDKGGLMPLPELWFVFNQRAGCGDSEFSTFPTKEEAQNEYKKAMGENREDMIDNDHEWDGDEAVYMGQVHTQAQVVPVAMDDGGDEVFDLVSYNTLPDDVKTGGAFRMGATAQKDEKGQSGFERGR